MTSLRQTIQNTTGKVVNVLAGIILASAAVAWVSWRGFSFLPISWKSSHPKQTVALLLKQRLTCYVF